MKIIDEIKKKTGVSYELSIDLFPRRYLKQYSGRSPDSKAISKQPSRSLINEQWTNKLGLLYYSCGDSPGIKPDSLLIPKKNGNQNINELKNCTKLRIY